MKTYLMAVLGFAGLWMLLAVAAASIDNAVGQYGKAQAEVLP